MNKIIMRSATGGADVVLWLSELVLCCSDALLALGDGLAQRLLLVVVYLRGLSRCGLRALPMASLPVLLCVLAVSLALRETSQFLRHFVRGVLARTIRVLEQVEAWTGEVLE